MTKNTFSVDCLKKVMIAGAISISLPFLFISNSFGEVYGSNPVTVKGYKGSKTNSTAYTGQMARQLLHNSLKKISSTGNPNDFTGGAGKKMLNYFEGKDKAKSMAILDPKNSSKFPVKQRMIGEISTGSNLSGKTDKRKQLSWPNNMTGVDVIRFMIKKGMSVVLDLGANIECSSKNLLDFSIMGASLYTSLYPNDKPNVALLNIGSEELKGNETIKETYQLLNEKKSDNYNFAGYIEGNHLMDGEVNVIVSDGFTGNVALKTAEGTANFITSELKNAMTGTLIGKISSLLNISNLTKFKKRLDPRLYNGAIFIGLDSPVVKSHGGTDYIGFSNSLDVCHRIVKGNLIEKIKQNI